MDRLILTHDAHYAGELFSCFVQPTMAIHRDLLRVLNETDYGSTPIESENYSRVFV